MALGGVSEKEVWTWSVIPAIHHVAGTERKPQLSIDHPPETEG